MTQNIWTFPVGITFSKDFALENGWFVRPSADFTLIPATGDIKGRQDVSFAGLPGIYEMESQTMDYLTWQGGLGLEVGNDDLTLGVNYTLQAGKTGTGHGVFAMVDGKGVLVGNDKLMSEHGIVWQESEQIGTILYVAVDGRYVGNIVIADTVKDDAEQTIRDLHAAGVKSCVMLTGDRRDVAEEVGAKLGLDEVHAQLLPQDKVDEVERLLSLERDGAKLAFVGDGINDAPVLMRADVGIAMGAMGSDAAIEAADVVLMDDKPSNIARAMNVARRTMRIVWQNIIFALGIKIAVLVLAALGIANMWLAVFGDVGVAIIAILNAMRAMRV